MRGVSFNRQKLCEQHGVQHTTPVGRMPYTLLRVQKLPNIDLLTEPIRLNVSNLIGKRLSYDGNIVLGLGYLKPCLLGAK